MPIGFFGRFGNKESQQIFHAQKGIASAKESLKRWMVSL